LFENITLAVLRLKTRLPLGVFITVSPKGAKPTVAKGAVPGAPVPPGLLARAPPLQVKRLPKELEPPALPTPLLGFPPLPAPPTVTGYGVLADTG
jgi:hypothetical protein